MTDQELRDLLEQNNKDLLHSMQVIIENTVKPQFSLLSEQIDLILDKLPDPEEMETMDYRVSALELSVKKLNKEIKQLKAANG